jgi:Polyketide cyclase / dehydrase and lipid transport
VLVIYTQEDKFMQDEINVYRDISAPASQVWPYLAAFGGLERWFPIIKACRVSGEGLGAVRELVLENDELMVDHLTGLDDTARQVSYSRVQLPFPVTDYVGVVSLHASGERACQLHWQVRYNVAEELQADMAALITGALTDGVAGLARELTGE